MTPLRRVAPGGLALALLACASSPPVAPRPPAPVDEDLLSLLPADVELVADLDVTQLRAWSDLPRIRPHIDRWIPPAAGVDPLAVVDLLIVGVAQTGTDAGETVALARGRFSIEQIESAWRSSLSTDSSVQRQPYHGYGVLTAEQRALAFVTERTMVMGTPAEVRRVLDLARGDELGFRHPGMAGVTSPSNALLLHALGRIPEAKSGRPALRMALRLTAPARSRLAAAGVAAELADHLDWIALALALGDGIDVGLVMGMRGAGPAQDLLERARLKLATVKQGKTVRTLGLEALFDAIRFGRKDDEAHFALRLDQRRFDWLWRRVSLLLDTLGQSLQASAEGR